MPTNNFIVSGLSAYVEQNRDILLKNFGLVGTATRKRIGIQTGVKGKMALHYLEIEPTLQSAEACGFTADGSITLTERDIEVARIKVNLDVCPDKLVGKYAEYLVRINATENDLPFERYIVDGILAEINKKIETLIWQGDKSKTADANLKWIDGLLVQFATEHASLAYYDTYASDVTPFAAVYQLYEHLTEEAIERGAEIYADPAKYRGFILGLMSANLFHFSTPVEAYPDEIFIPGTSVKLVNTPGLKNTGALVGTFPQNLVYGTDMENDWEDVKVWFSDDDDVYKIAAKWASGVAYHFPGHVSVLLPA